jgi:hypothetical protein
LLVANNHDNEFCAVALTKRLGLFYFGASGGVRLVLDAQLHEYNLAT